MGVVYEAEDTSLGRKVALKFLPAELAKDAHTLERFQREARAASALNHPGICTVHAIDQHEGQHFIAMELLEGETLAARIAGRALELGQLLPLTIQIADALESAHAKGIATDPRLFQAPYRGYRETHDPLEAAAFASCAASCVVEGLGTSTLGDRAEVEPRLVLRERFLVDGELGE